MSGLVATSRSFSELVTTSQLVVGTSRNSCGLKGRTLGSIRSYTQRSSGFVASGFILPACGLFASGPRDGGIGDGPADPACSTAEKVDGFVVRMLALPFLPSFTVCIVLKYWQNTWSVQCPVHHSTNPFGGDACLFIRRLRLLWKHGFWTLVIDLLWGVITGPLL